MSTDQERHRRQQILERQRRLASSQQWQPPPTDPTPAPSVFNNQRSRPLVPPAASPPTTSSTANVLAAARAKAQQSTTNSSNSIHLSAAKTALSSTSSSHKRPSANKKRALQLTAAAAALETLPGSQQQPSPKLQRKKFSAATTVEAPPGASSTTTTTAPSHMGALAQWVQQVAAAPNTADGLMESSSLPNIVPEDFWKNLRDWDFCSQYATYLRDQNQNHKTTTTTTSSSNNKKAATAPPLSDPSAAPATTSSGSKVVKGLPNVFLNARHYVAAWAPLCLAECRAQLMQEALSSPTWPNAVHVSVETTDIRPKRSAATGPEARWLEESDETGFYVILRPKNPAARASSNNGGDHSFSVMANDLCLLLRPQYKDILWQVARGTAMPPPGMDVEDLDRAYVSTALVGHTESSRSELNGLILKVSKRKWALLGQKEMYLVKLGGNVTGWREFAALCRVETLPMKRFLLGQHLEQVEHRRKLSRNQSTEQLLDRMGGSTALGAGFLQYARSKFNASQLTAIAASAHEYGNGGFTLIKGPPGTGKTTTLVAVLNSLHIRQYNKYYEQVRRIAEQPTGSRQLALEMAQRAKPRLLVCAPSNAAVDNVILKIMEDGFVDGQGQRYNPSMIRVGVGQGASVKAVALETKVDSIFAEYADIERLQSSMAGYRVELTRITQDIAKLRRRLYAIQSATTYPLSKDWEIRVDEDTFDETGRVYFVNHKEKITTYEVPPPPEPGESHFPSRSMPEYRSFMARVVKLVENYFSVKTHLERCTIVKSALDHGADHHDVRQNLETHVLNGVHMVMTTLGTAGNRALENTDKFEVVVVDEAAQCVEPACLSAMQLGSRQLVLVGDPQQLPATIFNVSGRNSKYDRSLFQRLEEAGQPVYMLNEQYRMHPKISHFPRHIFYEGALLDGPNVIQPSYGDPLRAMFRQRIPLLQPFTILDLDSQEERGGTSLSNSSEARLAVHLYQQLKMYSQGLVSANKMAIITPYAQQCKLLRRCFGDLLGPQMETLVEVNTVDAFQGREANVVIFSAVRAAGSHGIGFLSDVRRMNVALTRAKHFLLVIARCQSIVVNPYWNDLVQHARATQAVLHIPFQNHNRGNLDFGDMTSWALETASADPSIPPSPLPLTSSLSNPAFSSEVSGRVGDPRKRAKMT